MGANARGKSQIAASKKSAWVKCTTRFPNADKDQFVAQTYSDDKGNITGSEMFFKEGPGSLQSVFGSDRKYWRPQVKTAIGLDGFPYQLSPLNTNSNPSGRFH